MKPIKISHSILFFGIAALLFLFMERAVLPWLANIGVSKPILFVVMAMPHIIFFATALLGYQLEGNPWKWQNFKARFRYKPIKGKMWLWAILIVLVDVGLYLMVYQLAFPVVKYLHDLIPPPEIINDIMGNDSEFLGYPKEGNWFLLAFFLFYYFFNVFGEEFLWRGYLFPKQEMTHKKYTWVVHGLLWTMFHLFAPYNALMVLPGALFMSYVVQRTQNNTLFLLAHATLNGIPLVGLLLAIIG